MFNVEKLKHFYEEISGHNGIDIPSFYKRQSELFSEDRTTRDIENYRLGKNPWKKLRDEITPVTRFLKFNKIEADRIRFPLDNNTPDCWIINNNTDEIGIEVTIERGREQYHLAKELNQTGTGRGFIGLQDEASQNDFDKKMTSSRSMYTSHEALDATKAGILRCLSKKNKPKYDKIFYLLIHAHLTILPRERWDKIKDELRKEAANLPFQEIYIIGNADEEAWGFQIK